MPTIERPTLARPNIARSILSRHTLPRHTLPGILYQGLLYHGVSAYQASTLNTDARDERQCMGRKVQLYLIYNMQIFFTVHSVYRIHFNR